MLTLLLYVLIVGLVAILLFLLASVIFGRGEELSPLPEGTTETVLPAHGISGADVRALRFQQVLRGYRMGEVDWALARLAARLDELEAILAEVRHPHASAAAGNASADTASNASKDTASNASTGTASNANTGTASKASTEADADPAPSAPAADSEELGRTE